MCLGCTVGVVCVGGGGWNARMMYTKCALCAVLCVSVCSYVSVSICMCLYTFVCCVGRRCGSDTKQNEAMHIELHTEYPSLSLPHAPQNLVYDLGDSSKWEYFFPNVDKPLLIVPPGEDRPREMLDVGVKCGRGVWCVGVGCVRAVEEYMLIQHVTEVETG